MNLPAAPVATVGVVVLLAGILTVAAESRSTTDRLGSATRPGALAPVTAAPTPLTVATAVPTVTVDVPKVAVPTITPPVAAPPPTPGRAGGGTARTTTAPVDPPSRHFQGLHGPLPTSCISPSHACAYDDVRGAVPGGLGDLVAVVTSDGTLSVRWGPGTDNTQPAPVGVVLRLYRQNDAGALLVERRFEQRSGATTVTGLPAGTTIYVLGQELSSEGLSPGMRTTVEMPSTASATPQPSPTTTPDTSEGQ